MPTPSTTRFPGTQLSGNRQLKSRNALLFSRAGSPRLLGEGSHAGDLRRTGCELRPAQVSDPKSPAAAANGQYILIHARPMKPSADTRRCAKSLLEDVDLARAVKSSGRKIFFRFGGDAVRTRMYRSFAQLREGWTKNLALLFPFPVAPCPAATDRVCAYFSGRCRGSCGMPRRALQARRGSGDFGGSMYGFLLNRIRKAHFPGRPIRSALVGLPIFAYLLLRSESLISRAKYSGREEPTTTAPNHTEGQPPRVKPQRPAESRSA